MKNTGQENRPNQMIKKKDLIVEHRKKERTRGYIGKTMTADNNIGKETPLGKGGRRMVEEARRLGKITDQNSQESDKKIRS